MYFGLSIMRYPVQDAVTDEVCCPANSSAISSPTISESVVARPPLTLRYRESIST